MSRKCQPCGPGRSVVELTIAIHYVFNAPMDKILWDAGQHAYAHKILTGRRSLFHTIQQKNGLSGFTSRFESEYDPFGAGHGCNSLSAGLGIASICSSPSLHVKFCVCNSRDIFFACGIDMLLRSS